MSANFKVVQLAGNSYAVMNKLFFNPSVRISTFVQVGDSGLVYKTCAHESIGVSEVALNGRQREDNSVKDGDIIKIKPYVEANLNKNICVLTLSIDAKPRCVIDCDDFMQQVKQNLEIQPLLVGQSFSTLYKNSPFICLVKQIQFESQEGTSEGSSEQTLGMFTPETNCILETKRSYIELTNQFVQGGLFKKNLDLSSLGIGGLNREFQEMFRRAFVSRMQQEVAKKMGIKHTKGILLYGPPGCGKTLLARELGKLLNCEEPKIVSGPELLNSYVGKSEENVRNLFAEAMADTSGNKLYLIICDEFDALCKQRGSNRGDAGVGDNVVNQFLTMIDGPKQLNNILLICMTNRKDLIDDAILRAGRIDVHIEIQLPDQAGREEILTIHTKDMATNKYLHGTVNIGDLASMTKNYTGAELAGLVKNASSFALSREVNVENGKIIQAKKIHPIVTMDDFVRALNDIVPMFGRVSNDIQIINSTPFVFWSSQLSLISDEILGKIVSLKHGNVSTMLMSGPSYIGKTKFVAHVVKQSGIPCVKMITTEKLLKAPSKSQFITNMADQCTKAETSILIFDGFERIIEWLPIGPRFNNDVLQTIISIMTTPIAPNKKMILMFTANDKDIFDNFGISDSFDTKYDYPSIITKAEILESFPEIHLKCDFQDVEDVSRVFKYMKYV